MTFSSLTVIRLMDTLPTEQRAASPAGDTVPVPVSGGPPTADLKAWANQTPLGGLFAAMQAADPTVREAAWEACYRRCYQMVWTRVFYVMRTVSWLGEPRELAADVASDVFVGLPDAVRHYREEGNPEQWLKQVAIRTALRKKESLTGRWASGRTAAKNEADVVGRSYVSFEESAEQILTRLDAVEREELMELERRREALRTSSDETKRRWDEFLQLYIDGYEFQEIGARLGLTEASARNWLCKIRKHLAQPLGARGD